MEDVSLVLCRLCTSRRVEPTSLPKKLQEKKFRRQASSEPYKNMRPFSLMPSTRSKKSDRRGLHRLIHSSGMSNPANFCCRCGLVRTEVLTAQCNVPIADGNSAHANVPCAGSSGLQRSASPPATLSFSVHPPWCQRRSPMHMGF